MPSNQDILSYKDIEKRIVTWASKISDIQAIVVYGSRAQSQAEPDENSDLDLILFSTEQERYREKTDWLEDIAEVWLAVLDTTGAGDPEWFVLYEGGNKVDIILLGAEPMSSLVHLVNSSPYRIAIDRGMRVLHERPYLSMDRTRRTLDKATAASSLEVEFKGCIDHALMKLAKASMLYGRGRYGSNFISLLLRG